MYDIDLDLLRCFVAVAQTENFTLAGEKLHRSQSAISMRIKKLERVLGQSLLVRTSRHVTLTPEGETLLPMAKALLQEGEKLVGSITQPTLNGTLRIGLLEYIAPHRIAEVASAIKSQLPQITLQFQVGLSSQLKQAVKEGNLDIAFAISDDTETDNQFVFEDELFWVAGESYVFSKHNPIDVCLMKAPCFYRQKALSTGEQLNIEFNQVATCSSILSLREMVAAGLGISLLGKSALGKGIRALNSDELDFTFKPQHIPIALVGQHPQKKVLADILHSILVRDFL